MKMSQFKNEQVWCQYSLYFQHIIDDSCFNMLSVYLELIALSLCPWINAPQLIYLSLCSWVNVPQLMSFSWICFVICYFLIVSIAINSKFIVFYYTIYFVLWSSGFSKLMEMMRLFDDMELSSDLLKGLVQVDNEKGFPDLSDLLLFYKVCVESASGL